MERQSTRCCLTQEPDQPVILSQSLHVVSNHPSRIHPYHITHRAVELGTPCLGLFPSSLAMMEEVADLRALGWLRIAENQTPSLKPHSRGPRWKEPCPRVRSDTVRSINSKQAFCMTRRVVPDHAGQHPVGAVWGTTGWLLGQNRQTRGTFLFRAWVRTNHDGSMTSRPSARVP